LIKCLDSAKVASNLRGLSMNARFLNLLLKVWRLAVLAAAAVLLQRSAATQQRQSPVISLETAREFFPAAAKLTTSGSGTMAAFDSEDVPLGNLVTTSPEADHITGYSGPSNLLVAMDKTGRLAGIKILDSADTPSHVESLMRSHAFAQSIHGWNPTREPPPRVEGISGSTLTALAMIEGIAEKISGSHTSLRFPEPVSLEEIRALFPGAASFLQDNPRKGWLRVADADGGLAGYVIRTSPTCDGITGYAGPTECLVSVAPDQQTLREVRIRKSYDTEDYVERILDDKTYLKSLAKWTVSQWPSLNFETEKFEGVAGATLTSASIAESIRERLKSDASPQAPNPSKITAKDTALWLLLAMALLQSFTKLRSYDWFRRVWQLALICILGLWLGQFLSLGLFTGWAKNGAPWPQAAPLIALAVAALLIPWGTRRQVYCHHLCPHGAAQEWLLRLSIRQVRIPARVHSALLLLPNLLLIAAFLGALLFPRLALSNLEPFDFWVLGTTALIPAILAIAGLGISIFVPMAYCRYGCPTGALLSFMRSTSNQERFGRRDAIASLVLCIALLLTLRPWDRPSSNDLERLKSADHNPVHTLRGNAFGTTWCVKIKDAIPNQQTLHDTLSAEMVRIESTLSHWSKDSATSRFNANHSTDEQPIPEELGRLVEFALQLHQTSDGEYDITVAPLVAAWGYGPPGATQTPPSPEEITGLLARVGSDKLTLSSDRLRLRKSHPQLALDLGSILQGYAVDRLFSLLEEARCHDFLVEVGGELRSKNNWRVAIEDPRHPDKPLEVISLKDAALATSGLARARRKNAGETVSHIISPKTGHPVEPSLETCSVMSRTCLEADGWSTTLIASGFPKSATLVKTQALKVWLLDATGTFHRPE